jgi:hypothetical protein
VKVKHLLQFFFFFRFCYFPACYQDTQLPVDIDLLAWRSGIELLHISVLSEHVGDTLHFKPSRKSSCTTSIAFMAYCDKLITC